jgi:hypothetical protein
MSEMECMTAELAEHPSMDSYISHSDFPLPLFDEDSDVNPVLHLRHTLHLLGGCSLPIVNWKV